MQRQNSQYGLYPGLSGLGFALFLLFSPSAPAADVFQDALVGEADVYAKFRYRYEHVDDDLAPRDADASTLRGVFGYQSGTFRGFSALLEAEIVQRLGGGYREYPGQPGNNRAVVADPDSVELNQGYLQYEAAGNNRLRAGRQIITYRDAPFHRFMGTVLWRQNWQTHDAVSLENRSFEHTTLNYAYIWNVNRIFGDNAPSPLDDFDSDSHVFNIQYDRFDVANAEFYAYLLDFNNAPAASSATIGLRIHGNYPLTASMAMIYNLEYAWQTDYGDNPGDYNVGYQRLEGGLKFTAAAFLDSLVLKGGYERLSGTGIFAFQTPLGTNHAFQGTADRFLTTPRDGIRDYQAGAVATFHGFKLVAAWHVLESDKFDYRYGEEFDIEL
ncbi:MAG: hypothetical protein WD750_02750, partial [Gammaproteobacteria bacterium]